MKNDQKAFRDELRAKHRTRAKAASGRGKVAAIELFCLECVGGSSKEAKACTTKDCFLWKHGFERKQ